MQLAMTSNANFRQRPRTVRDLAPVQPVTPTLWDRMHDSIAFKFYIAQAVAGGTVGFAWPILRVLGYA